MTTDKSISALYAGINKVKRQKQYRFVRRAIWAHWYLQACEGKKYTNQSSEATDVV